MAQELREHFYPKGIVETKKSSDIKLQSGGKPDGLPMCPGCGHLMQRLLSIDAGTVKQIFGIETGDIDLVFCWRCPASIHFTFTGNLKNGFEFFSCWWDKKAGFPDEDEPIHKHPRMRKMAFQPQSDAANAVHLIRINGGSWGEIKEEGERLGLKFDEYDEPAYQIGGVPFLWGDPFDTECQRCGSPVKLIATVPWNNGTKHGWCGEHGEYVVMVFMRCEACGLIHASHQVD